MRDKSPNEMTIPAGGSPQNIVIEVTISVTRHKNYFTYYVYELDSIEYFPKVCGDCGDRYRDTKVCLILRGDCG